MLSCPCLLIKVGNSLAVITVAVVQRGDGFLNPRRWAFTWGGAVDTERSAPLFPPPVLALASAQACNPGLFVQDK